VTFTWTVDPAGLIALGAALIATVLSVMSLVVAKGANDEERKSRNVDAVLTLHERSQSTLMASTRGELLYGDRFDVLLVGGSNVPGIPDAEVTKRREELHGLLGIYEALGAATRAGLVDEAFVIGLFPRSVPEIYWKARAYIADYRTTRNHENFANNLEWLARRY
jgi:hypothetical protein